MMRPIFWKALTILLMLTCINVAHGCCFQFCDHNDPERCDNEKLDWSDIVVRATVTGVDNDMCSESRGALQTARLTIHQVFKGHQLLGIETGTNHQLRKISDICGQNVHMPNFQVTSYCSEDWCGVDLVSALPIGATML
eukprot:CAMPEP_0181301404 /NCGR_PEP_ID=MMETSP1101-20121128/7406_1 /TAXON_ID=46948 /ORGANISM="Rhodomonas abbreviata, Strain Caron Lab Isolate" /LENGTH=138 /DNA_ID=CAMNT_0023406707 /DNA_START=112 /DNA_END=525 /DNA_ORIENTATION=-